MVKYTLKITRIATAGEYKLLTELFSFHPHKQLEVNQ